jgi:ABC-type sulfate transport system permease component
VLVRYQFWGKRFVDALVDLPFALPTAVAGIALTAIYAPNGWIGHWLAPLGIKVAYTWLGVLVALTFIGLPFIVRTVQPVLEDFDAEIEESAASLGANRWQTFWRVTLPMLRPALLTGFTLAFARALGEYGSVVFIAGNIPMKTEITPLLIITKLEEFDYPGADGHCGRDARRFLRAAAGHQFPPMVEPAAITRQLDLWYLPQPFPRRAAPFLAASTAEPPFVRWLLISVALVFLGLFLFVPLAAVFTEAFAKGIGLLFSLVHRSEHPEPPSS